MNRKTLLSIVALASICFGSVAASACPSVQYTSRGININPDMRDCAYNSGRPNYRRPPQRGGGRIIIVRQYREEFRGNTTVNRGQVMPQQYQVDRQFSTNSFSGSRASSAAKRVPTPMEIYQKVAHKTTYQCVACAPGMGYVQDPVTCGCSGGNLTWHAGPPPAD